MASKVEIVNRALDKLGASRVVNIDTDATKQSRLAARMYDALRKKELSSNFWKFAKKRTTLAPNIVAPEFGWDVAYTLPADFVRLYWIDSSIPYELEDHDGHLSILTNEGGSLEIQYIADITDTSKFDALFVEAFASLLAQEMCEALTQSNNKRQLAIEEYRSIIKQARYMDAIQEPPIDVDVESWLEARL